MNIQISRREKMLITTLCVALILVMGTRFLVLPAYSSWITRKAQIGALEASRGKPADTAQNAAGESVAEAAASTAAFFLPKSTPEEVHRYFQAFVAASGLKLVDITISETSGELPQGFSNVNVRLALSGTQPQVMRFFEELESSGKAIAVDSMSLTTAGGQNVGFDVSLKAYCVDNGGDESLDFTPAPPGNAEGFRFAAQTGGGAK